MDGDQLLDLTAGVDASSDARDRRAVAPGIVPTGIFANCVAPTSTTPAAPTSTAAGTSRSSPSAIPSSRPPPAGRPLTSASTCPPLDLHRQHVSADSSPSAAVRGGLAPGRCRGSRGVTASTAAPAAAGGPASTGSRSADARGRRSRRSRLSAPGTRGTPPRSGSSPTTSMSSAPATISPISSRGGREPRRSRIRVPLLCSEFVHLHRLRLPHADGASGCGSVLGSGRGTRPRSRARRHGQTSSSSASARDIAEASEPVEADRTTPPPSRRLRTCSLFEDLVHVVLHRRQLDAELLGDLLVREAGIDQVKDLELPRGQRRGFAPVDRRVGADPRDGAAAARGERRDRRRRRCDARHELVEGRLARHEPGDAGLRVRERVGLRPRNPSTIPRARGWRRTAASIPARPFSATSNSTTPGDITARRSTTSLRADRSAPDADHLRRARLRARPRGRAPCRPRSATDVDRVIPPARSARRRPIARRRFIAGHGPAERPTPQAAIGCPGTGASTRAFIDTLLDPRPCRERCAIH